MTPSISQARILPEISDTPTASSQELVDLDIRDGRIARISPSGGPRPGTLNAEGALLLPGLWDAHAHLTHHALIADAVDLSGTTSPSGVLDRLREAPPPNDDLLVGFGFRAGGWEGQPPTAADLDTICRTPIALISGDGHCLWANSAALVLAGLPDHPTGFLVENEAFEATTRLMDAATEILDEAVGHVTRQAAATGLVGVVDMQMGWAVGAWARRAATSTPPLRIEAATYPVDLPRLIDEGWHTGDRIAERVSVGPLKIIADGSLGSKTAQVTEPYPHPLPGLPRGQANYTREELSDLLSRATAHGIAVAVHAIGDLAVRGVLDVAEATGAKGAIEHAQFVADQDMARFARVGLAASIQPAHLLDDAPLLDAIWPTAGGNAYPFRSLLDAGTRLTMGSDAPVAPLDPWLAMDAAVNRVHHPEQALTPIEALQASVRSRIAVGQPADLLLAAITPQELRHGRFLGTEVVTTLVAGDMTHGGR